MRNTVSAMLHGMALVGMLSPTVAAFADDHATRAGTSPWGPGDEIGTLNMMTDDSRTAIAERILAGEVYDLAVDLFVGMPNCCEMFGDPSYQAWMTHTPPRGDDHHGLSYSGDGVSLYTHMGTHIDALNHFGLHGEIWNGVTAEEALGPRGWTKSGIDAYPPILARAVMIDVPAAKGVEVLPDSYAITVADLQAALTRQGTDLAPGDVVLIRTGQMAHWPDRSQYQLMRQAGLGLDAAKWLAEEQQVMLIGADNFGIEAFPSTNPDNFAPVHTYLLAERGISMLEVVWLEDLARDQVYEMGFFASPLKLRGATASPVRPVAFPLKPAQ